MRITRRIIAMIMIVTAVLGMFTGCKKNEDEKIDQEIKQEVKQEKEKYAFSVNLEHVAKYDNGGILYVTPACEMTEEQQKFLDDFTKWSKSDVKAMFSGKNEITEEVSVAPREDIEEVPDDTEISDMDEDDEEYFEDVEPGFNDFDEDLSEEDLIEQDYSKPDEEMYEFDYVEDDGTVEIDSDWIAIALSEEDYKIIKTASKYCERMIISILKTTPPLDYKLYEYTFFDRDGNTVQLDSENSAKRFAKKRSEIELDLNETVILYVSNVTQNEELAEKEASEHLIRLSSTSDGSSYVYYATDDEEYAFLKQYFRTAHNIKGLYRIKENSFDKHITTWFNKPIKK